MPAEAATLQGRCVLVTRPARQAQDLARLLEGRGARVLRFPLVNIAGPPDPNVAQSVLASVGSHDLIVFTSPNAVRFAGTLLPDLASRVGRALIACVGDATATALERVGIVASLVPADGSTSEALLAMDAFDEPHVGGLDVLIVKGEGGRPLLARTLEERGARVSTVDVYRRAAPRDDLPDFLQRHGDDIDLAVITSGEALQRFVDLGGASGVTRLPLVVPSDRVLEQAVALGFQGPFAVPRRMTDGELAAAAARLAGTLN